MSKRIPKSDVPLTTADLLDNQELPQADGRLRPDLLMYMKFLDTSGFRLHPDWVRQLEIAGLLEIGAQFGGFVVGDKRISYSLAGNHIRAWPTQRQMDIESQMAAAKMAKRKRKPGRPKKHVSAELIRSDAETQADLDALMAAFGAAKKPWDYSK